ncbi:MAG: hypothetical protein GX085_01955 [Firmicutes bacterium]|nr:hypothetical protein [Bacillota bacterium]
MKKVVIRHEPVLRYLYIFGILSVVMLLETFAGGPAEAFFVILLIESFFVVIHIVLRSEILAEIDNEGIDMIGKRFIPWREIEKWSYEPSNGIYRNSLKIRLANGEEYQIKGFSYLKVTRCLKRYAPEKQSRFSLVWDLFIRGIFILFIVLLFLDIIKE